MIYKSKVVGRSFHKVENEVEDGDYLILVEDLNNPYDRDAICCYNGDHEIVGFIANSDRTLSPNNVRNGNLPASVIKKILNFNNREYYAEVINVFKSCIYLEINDSKWSYKRY